MTRNEFIERYRHQLVGYATDGALSDRRAGEFAMWMRMRMKQIDQLCGEMFDEAMKAAHGKPHLKAAN
jgi:hypothetical protein